MKREQIARWVNFNLCQCGAKAVTYKHGWACQHCLDIEAAYYASSSGHAVMDRPKAKRPERRQRSTGRACRLHPVAAAYYEFRNTIRTAVNGMEEVPA